MYTKAFLKHKVFLILAGILVLALVSGIFYHNLYRPSVTPSFRFVVMGDSRGVLDGTNEKILRTLLENIKGLPVQPAFILFAGDMVFGGSDVAQEIYEWKDIVDDYYPITRVFPAIGNHEGDETIFSHAFPHLPKEQLVGYGRTAYYFDYGQARFICLNSIRKDARGKYIISGAQRAWLENLLQNNPQTHTFVMLHCPPYSVGPHFGSALDGNPGERDAFWEIIDKYRVTAVFAGHEHNYNRRLVDNSFNAKGYHFRRQIYQLTTGGAGAPPDFLVLHPDNILAGPKAVYHYMVVDVAGSRVTFSVYDKNNRLIDAFFVEEWPDAITKSFQDGVFPSAGYTGTRDAQILEKNPKDNFGKATLLHADGDMPIGSGKDAYVLMKWDLSAIPPKSKILSATITVRVTNRSGLAYELYPVKVPWSESRVTWYQYDDLRKWQVAGAQGSDDKANLVMGTLAPRYRGTQTLILNRAGIAQIQDWVDHPDQNHGLLLANTTNGDGIAFFSREYSVAQFRPKLTVTYREERSEKGWFGLWE